MCKSEFEASEPAAGVSADGGAAVDVRLVPFGTPALEALNAAIGACRAASGGHPLDPVAVVVPSSSACITLRRALARRRTVGVEVLTPVRLARRLAGHELREVNTTVLAGVLRNVLGSSSAGVFAAVAGHPSTERTLLEAHRNLGFQTAEMLAVHEQKSLMLRDVVGVHREVRRRLAAGGWSEERDVMEAASEALDRKPASVQSLPPVFVYLPGRLKKSELGFLIALGKTLERAGSPLVVFAGVTGVPSADAATSEVVSGFAGVSGRAGRVGVDGFVGEGGRVGVDGFVSGSGRVGVDEGDFAGVSGRVGVGGFAGVGGCVGESGRSDAGGSAGVGGRAGVRALVDGSAWRPLRPPLPAQTRIIETTDADEEVRTAIRGVAEGLRDGVDLNRMAIVYPVRVPYLRLLTDQLGQAGLPFHGLGVGTLAESILGRFLLGFLELTEGRFGREDLFGWLNSAPVRAILGGGTGAESAAAGGAGLAAGGRMRRRLVPVAAWERLSRIAGVGSGGEWRERLARFRHDRERDLALLDEETDYRRAVIERQITHCDELEGFVDDLRRRSRAAGKERTWQGLARWSKKQIGDFLGDADWRSRVEWPQHEQKAAEKVEQLIEGLSGLDEVDPNPDLPRFRRSLLAELGSSGMFTGRLGHGLLISTPEKLTGVELQRVWILGMAEGVFPSRAYDDPLIGELDEARGAQARLADEQRSFLETLASASEERTLLYPRGDLRNSGERFPSRWLSLLVAASAADADAAGDAAPAVPADAPVPSGAPALIERIPSQIAAALSCPFPVTESEYNLRELLAAPGRLLSGRHPLSAPEGVLRRPLEMLACRSSDRFTRFDGNLSGVDVPRLSDAEHAVSPSRLEKWAECPHAYFMRYLLGVEPLEDAARELRIPPLERGDLLHNILDRFFREHVLVGKPLRRGERWGEERRGQLRRIAEGELDAAEQQGRTGHQVFWEAERSRILRDLERFLSADEEYRGGGWIPLASEQGFARRYGRDPEDTHPPVSVELPDGRTVLLTGRVDRIDVSASGDCLAVIDYKTGRFDAFNGLGEGDLLLHAGSKKAKKTEYPDNVTSPKLQLPLYARAVRSIPKSERFDPDAGEVVSAYWFVSGRENFRFLTLVIDEGVEEEFARLLGLILDGIEGGVFPPRPVGGARDHCEFCRVNPDHGESARRFRRKAFAPELQACQTLTQGAAPLNPARLKSRERQESMFPFSSRRTL